MASSSDQAPDGHLFTGRWRVFQYWHIAERYCTLKLPLAMGRLRYPAFLIVDETAIQEWARAHGAYIPCPNCVMFVQKGIMGKNDDYVRTDWHGFGQGRIRQEYKWHVDAQWHVDEVSFNWLGSLVDPVEFRMVQFESLLPIPNWFIGYHMLSLIHI